MRLYTLLGEQPIPNLIPLWQAPQMYSEVGFVVSARTRPQAEALQAVVWHDTALRGIRVLPPLEVEAYDLVKTRQVLAGALEQFRQAGRAVCLNLTGGTKLMSLAALQAAQMLGVPWFYVSTELQQIIHYTPEGEETRREPIRVRVGVEIYLRAHGLEVSLGKPIEARGAARSPQPTPGHALEKDVFGALYESQCFDDVQRNVYIRKGDACGQFVDNELDIVATYNGMLVVGSCKTGKILSAHLYELSALSRREVAGIYARKALIYRDATPRPGIVRRAQLDEIALIPGYDLNNVVREFKRLLSIP